MTRWALSAVLAAVLVLATGSAVQSAGHTPDEAAWVAAAAAWGGRPVDPDATLAAGYRMCELVAEHGLSERYWDPEMELPLVRVAVDLLCPDARP